MKQLFAAIVACMAFLVACGDPEAKFIGKYDSQIEMPQEYIDMMKVGAARTGQDIERIIAELENPTLTMELKKDGVCTMTGGSQGNARAFDATWSLNEDGTEITVKMAVSEGSTANANMMPGVNADMVLAVSDGGKVLTFDEKRIGMKMTFTRQ